MVRHCSKRPRLPSRNWSNLSAKADHESYITLLTLAVLSLTAFAADITGTWTAEFETQIGIQKYTFTFKQEGNSLTGKANSEIGGEKYESKLKDGKVKGDAVSFVEELKFQGNDLEIRYTGKVSGKEIKFARQVGDFATEQLVAKLDAPAGHRYSERAVHRLASNE